MVRPFAPPPLVTAPRYRVLVLSPEGSAGWTLCGTSASLDVARISAIKYRMLLLVAAVVDVTPGPVPVVEVVEANVPHPRRLLKADGFRRVATAL